MHLSKGISQPEKTADSDNIWNVNSLLLFVSTSILQVRFTKSLIGQNRCNNFSWDIYKKFFINTHKPKPDARSSSSAYNCSVLAAH